ncbi:MAG: hypothetical protein GY798_19870 [Hyphomicrobiales bacterium]|nr:hypothetical protein [Hyphomicrobiales bacterium]
MITRYALFEGSVKDGKTPEFRAAVFERLVPLWQQFPGANEVRVMFGEDRDEGAPEFPLILAISYPDHAAMEQALQSAPRSQSREVTGEIVAAFFDGRIHHHVTSANHYDT